jgi:hypothetical protein
MHYNALCGLHPPCYLSPGHREEGGCCYAPLLPYLHLGAIHYVPTNLIVVEVRFSVKATIQVSDWPILADYLLKAS